MYGRGVLVMGFMKDVVIYEKGRKIIYINQCHNKGRKTKLYAIRKDDSFGMAEYLGGIKFNDRWRQYVFEPHNDTIWSWECMIGIVKFLQEINRKWRRSKR